MFREPKLLRLLAISGLFGLLAFAVAQAPSSGAVPVPSVKIDFGAAAGKDQVSASLQILALLTVLSIAPAILILTTAFTRIVIIFSFVRSALGTPTVPPNQVVIGLSLFLTLFVMAPTYGRINDEALKPYRQGTMNFDQALQAAQAPVREFMLKNTYDKDLRLFIDLSAKPGQAEPSRDDISLITLIPAFVISELKTAFIVGFYIFIPFLIIDLIVASTLMSMGMMMMPPIVVALPAKLLVFVLADGWSLLVNTILSGYR